MATFPNAPALPPAAIREVFTYPDPSRAPDERNPYSDASRLNFLGEKMAAMAYHDVMAERLTNLDVQTLQHHIRRTFPGFVERTARAYAWNRNVRGYPADADQNSPNEARRLFFTYAGAVSRGPQGYYALKEWIISLLDFGI